MLISGEKPSQGFAKLMRICLTLVTLLLTGMLYAQVPGSILDPADPAINPMNPNGDGFITSTNSAFTGSFDETQFELPFVSFQQYQSEPGNDNQYAAGCEVYELMHDVAAGAESAYFYYNDPDAIPDNGDELIFFRFRLARWSNGVTAFSVLVDTDYLFGISGPEADPNGLPGNPGFEKEIAVYNSTGQTGGVRVFNVDGMDTATVVNYYAPNTSHYQVSYALNQDPGCTDLPVFVDMYIPFSALGILSTTQVRMAVAVNEDINSSLGGGASDIGGVNGNTLPDDDDQFLAAITNHAPIAIGNLINKAPLPVNATVSLDENSSNGSLVHAVSASDPNSDALTYSITGGNTGAAFVIDSGTGVIIVNNANALDREAISVFILVVRVDDGLLYDNAIITVKLNDLNEGGPTISDATVALNENTANGSLVHSMGGTDPDATAVLNYSITGGNTNDAFTIDNISGEIKVNNSGALDFEATPIVFGLNVRASDGDLFDDAIITVNLLNVNETPVVEDASITIERWLENDEIIHAVVARDPDANDVLSYALDSGDDDALFTLDPETGEISVRDVEPLKHRTRTFDLVVSVTDKAGLTATGVIHIVIVRIPDRSDIHPHKGFSPNNDGTNDFWLIEGIEAFPKNSILVFNRWGITVYETSGYDNNTQVWRGEGKGTTNTVESTYFYIIKAGDFEPITGYLIVKP